MEQCVDGKALVCLELFLQSLHAQKWCVQEMQAQGGSEQVIGPTLQGF